MKRMKPVGNWEVHKYHGTEPNTSAPFPNFFSTAGLYHRDPSSTAPATPIRERDPNAKFSDEMFKTMHEITSYSVRLLEISTMCEQSKNAKMFYKVV